MCWYFLSAFAFLRKWKFWGWLECTVRYRVSSTQTVVASTSWRPCYETNFLTCFINKLVQNKSLPLDFGFVRARGAGSPWAYWRAPPKSPTVKKLCPLETCLLRRRRQQPRCANQVEVVREEQLDRGRCQALLWIGWVLQWRSWRSRALQGAAEEIFTIGEGRHEEHQQQGGGGVDEVLGLWQGPRWKTDPWCCGLWEQLWWCPGSRSPIRHWGEQEADGAFSHLHLQGVGDLQPVLLINCSCHN